MIAIEILREQPVSDRRGQVAKLHQAIEAQLADPVEVALIQARACHHRRQELERARRILLQRGELQQRRVGADLGVQMRPDPAERFVHGERVEVAAALVQQIAGDGGEPGLVRRIL